MFADAIRSIQPVGGMDLELGMLSFQKRNFDPFQIGAFDKDGNITNFDDARKEVQIILHAGLTVSVPGISMELSDSVIMLGPTGMANIDCLEIKKADLPDGVEECVCKLRLRVVEPTSYRSLPACELPFTFCRNSDWTAALSSIDNNIKISKKKSKRLEDDFKANEKKLAAVQEKMEEKKAQIVGNTVASADQRLSTVQNELTALDCRIQQREAEHEAADLNPDLRGSRPQALAEGLLGVPTDFATIDAEIEVAVNLRIALSAHFGPRMNALIFASDQALAEFQESQRAGSQDSGGQERRRRLVYSVDRAWKASTFKSPRQTPGYLGPVSEYLSYSMHCDAKAQKIMQAFVGDLAVFETYSSAQTYGQNLWRQDKQAPSMVGLDKPTRIIRSDGGEYRKHSDFLYCLAG